MKREFWIGAGEAGDEVVFKGSDGAFGGVAAMDVGWCELEVDIFFGEMLLENFRGFVVEFHELWTKAAGDKKSVCACEGVEKFGAGVAFGWFCENGIAVVVIENEKSFVARAGSLEEAAGLIGVYLAGDRLV